MNEIIQEFSIKVAFNENGVFDGRSTYVPYATAFGLDEVFDLIDEGKEEIRNQGDDVAKYNFKYTLIKEY